MRSMLKFMRLNKRWFRQSYIWIRAGYSNLIDQLISRLQHYEGRKLDANFPEAGILVPVTNEKDPQIILTRRAEHLKTHRGQVAFPGGKVDPEDADTLATALRESEEEIGLAPEQVRYVGELSQLISLHGFKVSPYVGLVEPDVALQANYDELESIFKVPIQFLLNAEPSRRDRMTYKGIVLNVPSYDYEYNGQLYEIWGLSAVVLVELLNVAYNAGIEIFEPSRKRMQERAD